MKQILFWMVAIGMPVSMIGGLVLAVFECGRRCPFKRDVPQDKESK